MFTTLVRSLDKSEYQSRLWARSWIFFFVLLLELIVNIHFVSVSSAGLPPNSSLSSYMIVMGKAFLRGLFWAVLFWWGYAIPKGNVPKRLLGGLIVLLSSSLFVLEEFLLTRYGTVYSHSIILIIAGTNMREATEYMNSSFSLLEILALLSTILCCLIGTLYLSCFIQRIMRRSFAMRLIVLFGSVLPIAIGVIDTIPDTWDKVSRSGHAYDYTLSPMDRVIWNTLGFIREHKSIGELVKKIRSHDHQRFGKSSKLGDHTIVLIIGESLRRDYMHCYGFPLNTTPLLDSIITETGRVVLFSDAVAPAPNTIESLTKVLSLQSVDDQERGWSDYPALTSLFSQNGYWVQWTSNQESIGVFIQPLNAFAMLCDGRDYVHARSIDAEHNESLRFFDEDVLPHLKVIDEVKSEEKSNLLQIVHLQGSHPEYSKRYPAHFAQFHPSDMPIDRGEERNQIVSSYVNSVLYNDYVVASIIKHYDREKAIIIYISDHGEVLYDDPRNPNYADHGMTHESLSVPLLIYFTESMMSSNAELFTRLESYKDRSIMLDQLTYSLMDLVGMDLIDQDVEKSFFSDRFDSTRPRVIKSFSQEVHF